jgi:hypothetical protein
MADISRDADCSCDHGQMDEVITAGRMGATNVTAHFA